MVLFRMESLGCIRRAQVTHPSASNLAACTSSSMIGLDKPIEIDLDAANLERAEMLPAFDPMVAESDNSHLRPCARNSTLDVLPWLSSHESMPASIDDPMILEAALSAVVPICNDGGHDNLLLEDEPLDVAGQVALSAPESISRNLRKWDSKQWPLQFCFCY